MAHRARGGLGLGLPVRPVVVRGDVAVAAIEQRQRRAEGAKDVVDEPARGFEERGARGTDGLGEIDTKAVRDLQSNGY